MGRQGLLAGLATLVLSCGAAPKGPDSRVMGNLILEAQPTARQLGEDGWTLSGGGGSAYTVSRDERAQRNGHATWALYPHDHTYGKYGTWMRVVEATPYLGKRVRISGYTKTQGTTTRADFWARIQAKTSPTDGSGLAGRWHSLPADSPWTMRKVVLDVPSGAHQIQYGVGVAGAGIMWLDEPKLEIVPTTPEYDGEQTIAEWTKTGVGAPDYALAAEPDGVRVEASTQESMRFVAVVRAVPARDFQAKPVKASLEVRTEGTTSGGCVLKVQRERTLRYAGFLASDFSALPPTSSGFVRCDLVATVPSDAEWLLFGYTYRGPGRAWLRGGTVAEVP